MRMRRTVALVALLALCSGIAVTTAPSDAASGLAWDQVMKFSMDGTVPEPNFAQDWQTASQPAPQQQQHGGMFGGMTNQINGAMAMAQSMRTGMAERHFAAGNLERTDNIAAQTATIVDCGARTITYLDLAKKTYRVVSMDQPQTASRPTSGGSRDSSPIQDDGTRFKVAYTSQALGPKSIDGVNTDGYKAASTITITKSDGSSQTMTTDMTQYFSSYGQPAASCPAGRRAMAAMPGGGGMAAMMSSMNMMRMMNDAMRTPSGDQRFTFSSTGPPLPAGRLDMFSVYQTQGQNSQGRSFAMVLERGNVRPVSDTDKSVFGIPPDFTQEK
jgi:hypothetical protein